MILFFSVNPIQCDKSDFHECRCYFSEENKANIFNCSNADTKNLPSSVLKETDWLLMENSNVKQFFPSVNIYNTIKYLSLRNSRVTSISEDILVQVNSSPTLKWLDLSQNQLQVIPENIKTLRHIEKIWLGENPFHCDCKMTWMVEWLNNYTNPEGNRIVVDYKDLRCTTGLMLGIPIYDLNEVVMGCYPAKLSLGQKIGIGTGSVLVMVLMVVIFLVARNPREVKFFMYYYLKVDTVPKDDKNENVENMYYDAFFCYR